MSVELHIVSDFIVLNCKDKINKTQVGLMSHFMIDDDKLQSWKD